jgi:hypothetical protein
MIADKSHVVSGLIAKRAELAGRIEATQSELRRLVIDLDSLDATIRLFVPDIDLTKSGRSLYLRAITRSGAKCLGRCSTRSARPANRFLHTNSRLFMASRGLATADKPLLRVIHKRVGACLRNYRNKGLVRAIDGPTRSVLWEIAR